MQGALLPVDVKVNVTFPVAISPTLGVYITLLSVVAFGENVPVPLLLVQIPPVAFVTEPLNVIVALLAHTVLLLTAVIVAVGFGTTVIVTCPVPGHPLLLIYTK